MTKPTIAPSRSATSEARTSDSCSASSSLRSKYAERSRPVIRWSIATGAPRSPRFIARTGVRSRASGPKSGAPGLPSSTSAASPIRSGMVMLMRAAMAISPSNFLAHPVKRLDGAFQHEPRSERDPEAAKKRSRSWSFHEACDCSDRPRQGRASDHDRRRL